MDTVITIVILAVIFWWIFLKENRFTNPRKKREYHTDWPSNVKDLTCPECGHDDVKLNIYMEPILVKCRNCGHEWIYVPRRTR